MGGPIFFNAYHRSGKSHREPDHPGAQGVVPAIPDMDVAAVSIAALLLMLVAVLSSLWPAHRATRIGPVVALKGD